MSRNRTVAFFRRIRRLVLIAATIVGDTILLNLTVGRKAPEERLAYRASRQSAACRRVLRIWNIDLIRHGPEEPAEAAVIACNHLGVADGFVVSALFPIAISGKAELLSVPVVAWVCRSIAMIPVYRQKRLLSADFAEEVARRLDAGVHVLVFPEGTTSAGTEVMPFKTGGFAAIEGKPRRIALPIALVVVAVNGEPVNASSHALFTWSDPDQSLFRHLWILLGIDSARIEVVVGQPIPADNRNRKELADRCHLQISAASKTGGSNADTS
ncbi:MAG: lysophospholipid acyltransferase family protein [Rhodothermales bacterium]|nr:lysophospholipid acyltransferase family protein [Rhodothermales bacterium]